MSARPLRRKELKGDEFVSTAEQAGRWLLQRRRRIGLVVLAGVVLLSVVVGIRVFLQHREERAAGLLAAAMEIYRAPVTPTGASADATVAPMPPAEPTAMPDGTVAGSQQTSPTATQPAGQEPATPAAGEGAATEPAMPPPATPTAPLAQDGPTVDEPSTLATGDEHGVGGHPHFATDEARLAAARDAFRPIVEEYGGTSAGRIAAYYMGLCQADLGEIEAAVETLRGAAETSSLIGAMAIYRLGDVLLEAGRTDEAVAAFERLTDGDAGLFPRENALLGKARAHEAAGNDRAALAAYQQILDDHPGSFLATDARERVEELSARLGLDPDIQG